MLPATDLHSNSINQPIGPEEFAALMAPLGPWLPDVLEAPVAIAVSGGADSMALAFLTRRWRRSVVVLVVDHGLRPEAAHEAALTVERLEQMGLRARILTLGSFLPGRVQERARQARFDALEAACVAEGCLDLLVAHHADDQVETVWMRHARGSGSLGLSGIWATALRGRIRLVRPLLNISPGRLRATLVAASIPWIEDPSNHNRRFERVRWRQDLTAEQRREAWSLHEQACTRVSILGVSLAQRLARSAVWHPGGWVFVQPDGVCEDVVAVLIRLLSGTSYRPARDCVEALVKKGCGSLGGVVLRPAGRFGDGVLLVREERAVQPNIPAASGVVWDGRWRLGGSEAGWGPEYTIGALGDGVWELDLRRLGFPREAARTLPAVWNGKTLAAFPAVLGGNVGKQVCFDWAGALPLTGDVGI